MSVTVFSFPLFLLYSWKKTRTRTSLMDRQARKLQIAREQQGYHEGGAILTNAGESGEAKSLAKINDVSSTAEEGLALSGNRISDLTLLSDDDDKEVISDTIQCFRILHFYVN